MFAVPDHRFELASCLSGIQERSVTERPLGGVMNIVRWDKFKGVLIDDRRLETVSGRRFLIDSKDLTAASFWTPAEELEIQGDEHSSIVVIRRIGSNLPQEIRAKEI
jgi:hypothetical protein